MNDSDDGITRGENIPHEAMQYMVLRGWMIESVTRDDSTVPPTLYYTLRRSDSVDLMDVLRDMTAELLDMLNRFASCGEQLWDDENFMQGYKKVSSGDLVDCRNLLRKFGVTDFNE